ncbi:hypothetical protein SVIOM74S_02802 [Streptomyces violarus]
MQRRIADAEIAAERLGLLLLSARSARRADTLTLHLPGAPAPTVRSLPGSDEAMGLVRRDLGALRELVLRPPAEARGTALSHLRNRLLGYREEENLPAASPAVQDVFRGIGETARAVLGLRVALDGPQDESDDFPRPPARARSWTPRTPRSTPVRSRPRRRSRPGCGGRPPGPRCRWRSGPRWPSSGRRAAVRRSAGTGRC